MSDISSSAASQHGQIISDQNLLCDILKAKFNTSNASSLEKQIIKHYIKYSQEDLNKFLSLLKENYQITAIFDKIAFPSKPNTQIITKILENLEKLNTSNSSSTKSLSSFIQKASKNQSNTSPSEIIVFGSLYQGLAWIGLKDNQDLTLAVKLLKIYKYLINSQYSAHVIKIFSLVVGQYLVLGNLKLDDSFCSSVISFISECKSLSSDFTNIFTAFLTRVLNSGLKKSINLILSEMKNYITEKRPFIALGNGAFLYQSIASFVQSLNGLSIEILYWASLANEEIIDDIANFSRIIAHSLISKILNNKPTNQILNQLTINFSPNFQPLTTDAFSKILVLFIKDIHKEKTHFEKIENTGNSQVEIIKDGIPVSTIYLYKEKIPTKFRLIEDFAFDGKKVSSLYDKVRTLNPSLYSLIPKIILDHLPQLTNILAKVDKAYVEIILDEITSFQSNETDDHFLDLYVVVLYFIIFLHKKINIHKYLNFLLSSKIFVLTKNNIFSDNSSDDGNNKFEIRYVLYSFLMGNYPNLLYLIFTLTSKISPIINAEVILFILANIQQFGSLKRFCDNNGMYMLSTANTSSELQYACQKSNNKENHEEICLARMVYLKFIFTILEKPELFMLNSSSIPFGNEVINLIFEQNLSELIFQYLIKSFSFYHIQYSSPTYFYIISVFGEILDNYFYNLNQNKLNDLEKASYSNLTNYIFECTYQSLCKNQDVILSFYPLVTSLLGLISYNPNEDLLKKILFILSLIPKIIKSFKFSNNFFVNIMNIISQIEGKNPSAEFHTACKKLLTGNEKIDNSTFIIQYPIFIPIYIISFSQSSSIETIFQFFDDICKISQANCVACHKGDLDFFIIKLLDQQRKFTYNGYLVDFSNFNENINPLLLDTLIKIIKVKTNISICDKLIQKIIRNPTQFQNSDSNSLELRILTILIELISSNMHQLTPIFDMITNRTVCQISGSMKENIKNNFGFSFWIKADIPQSSQILDYYSIFVLKHQNSEFRINLKKNYLTGEFTENNNTSSVILLKNLPSNEWVFVTVEWIKKEEKLYVLNNFQEAKTIDLNSVNFNDDSYTENNSSSSHSSDEILITIGSSSNCNSNIILGKIGPFGLYDPSVIDHIKFKKIVDLDPNMMSFDEAYFTSADIIDSKKYAHILPNSPLNPTSKISRQNKDKHNFDFSINKQPCVSQNINNIIENYYDLNYITYIFSKFPTGVNKFSIMFFELILLTLSSSIPAQDGFKSVPLLTKAFAQIFKNNLSYNLYVKIFQCFANLKNEELIKEFFEYLMINLNLWGQADFATIKQIIQHWSIYSSDSFKPFILKLCKISRLISMLDIFFFSEPKIERINDNSCGVQTSNSYEEWKTLYSLHLNHSKEEVNEIKDIFIQFITSIAQLTITSNDIFTIYMHLFQRYTINNKLIIYSIDSTDKYTIAAQKYKTIELLNLISKLSHLISKVNVKAFNFEIAAPLLYFMNFEDDEIVESALVALHNISQDKVHIYMSIASTYILRRKDFSSIFRILVTKCLKYKNFYSLICILALNLGSTEIDTSASVLQGMHENAKSMRPELGKDLFWAVWPIIIGIIGTKSNRKSVVSFLADQILRNLEEDSNESISKFIDSFVDIYTLIYFLANDYKSEAYYLQSDLTLHISNLLFQSKEYENYAQTQNEFLKIAFCSIFFFYSYFRNLALYEAFKNSPFSLDCSDKNAANEVSESFPIHPFSSFDIPSTTKNELYEPIKEQNLDNKSTNFDEKIASPKIQDKPYSLFSQLLQFSRPDSVTNKPLIFELRITISGEWVDKKLCDKLLSFCSKFANDPIFDLYRNIVEYLNDRNNPERDINTIKSTISELEFILTMLNPCSMIESLSKSIEYAKQILDFDIIQNFGITGFSNIRRFVEKNFEEELSRIREMEHKISQSSYKINKDYVQRRNISHLANDNIVFKRDNCFSTDFCPFKIKPEILGLKHNLKIWEINIKNDATQNRDNLIDVITQTENSRIDLSNDSQQIQSIIECYIIKSSGNQKAKLILSDKMIILFILESQKILEIKPQTIKYLFKRKRFHKDTAIEIFLTNGKSYFIDISPRINEEIFMQISKLNMPFCKQLNNIEKYTTDWINGKLSNFAYLMNLNIASGRSFQDITQYPIFPSIFKDFNSGITRDLSQVMDFYGETPELEIDNNWREIEELFHSSPITPEAIDNYLVRTEPFTTLHLHKQNYTFQKDKIFQNMDYSFNNKVELIPEFFFCPEILMNLNKLQIPEFQLPENLDPFEFIYKHRKFLESDEVTNNLHNWIDLIWGVKQKGEEAEKSFNFRHPFILDNVWQSEASFLIKAEDQVYSMIHLYGTMPVQLFSTPHPKKIFHKRIKIIAKGEATKGIEYTIHDAPILFAHMCTDSTIYCIDANSSLLLINIQAGNSLLLNQRRASQKECKVKKPEIEKALSTNDNQTQLKQRQNSLFSKYKTMYIQKYKSKIVIKLSLDTKFCKVENGIIIMSQINQFLSILHKENIQTFQFESYDVDFLNGSGGFFVVVSNRTIVTLYNVVSFPKSAGQIVILDDIIIDCQINMNFCTIAILSRNGMLHLHSINKMQKIKSIDLNEFQPKKLIITEKWGFILVSCETKLLLFNINGKLMKTIDFNYDIQSWYCFSSLNGFDYIIFESASHQIGMFEAFYPIETLRIIGQLFSSVIFIHYMEEKECVYIITENGKLFLLFGITLE